MSSELPQPRSQPAGSPALALRNVSKRFNLGVTGSQGFTRWSNLLNQRTTMASAFVHWARHPLTRAQKESFWALKDVSFELEQGAVLGLVGRNGAGKSTLLKLISRITDMTEGQIELYGRVGSLLEVGTGFHPELTGRENIYLNGAILGMRRREIDAEFEAIVEFAGVAAFLDTPVKRFSSGMNVRLAFAIAAHLRSEILLVDEVLAVGDKQFRDQCLGKLSNVATSGRTVIYVSHLMETVTQLCSEAVLLEKGRLTMHGQVSDVVSTYLARQMTDTDLRADMDLRPGMGALRLVDIETNERSYDGDDEKVLEFTAERRHPSFDDLFYVTVNLIDDREVVVASCNSRLLDHPFMSADEVHGRVTMRTPWLKPGRYRVDVSLTTRSGFPMDVAQAALFLDVGPKLPYPGVSKAPVLEGVVFPDCTFSTIAGRGNAARTTANEEPFTLPAAERAGLGTD